MQVEVGLNLANSSESFSAHQTHKSRLPHSVYGYPAAWGRQINATFKSTPQVLTVSQPLNACSSVVPPPSLLSRYAALVATTGQGDCSSVEKAKFLFDAGFEVMLLYENLSAQMPGSSDGCVYMVNKDGHDNASATLEGIAGVSITHKAAEMLMEILKKGDNVTITLSMPQTHDYDPAEAILWLIAVLVITTGSLWSGKDVESRLLDESMLDSPSSRPTGQNLSSGILVLTPTSAGSFVIVASTALLVLYFLMSRILMELLALLFVVMAWDATCTVLSALLHWGLPAGPEPGGSRIVVNRIAFSVAGCTAGAWYVCRFLGNVAVCRHVWWVLQDVLSGSIMAIILRTAYIPNLKVATILLVGALIYDVWWVFLQPIVLGGGSVMVDVVSRGSSLSFGSIPMVLVVPSIWGIGTNPAMALLGLGDVVIPGLLVAAVRRWEVSSRGQGSPENLKGFYFGYLVIGYAAGLLLTFVALARGWGGEQGQPALLYLAPFTLAPALFLSWVHGDFARMWSWNRKHNVVTDDECIEDGPLLDGEHRLGQSV